jgi:hypothetical protein
MDSRMKKNNVATLGKIKHSQKICLQLHLMLMSEGLFRNTCRFGPLTLRTEAANSWPLLDSQA